MRSCLLLILTLSLSVSVARAQTELSPEAGALDNGKMWLFEDPPLDYLETTYGFRPDASWLERARLAALRIPGCSASFVSENGLVVTNHHCVRGRLPSIQADGESLLDNGFHANDLADERRIPGYYADQLVAAVDVSDEIDSALAEGETDAEREAALEAAQQAIQTRLLDEYAGSDSAFVQIVPLYTGGRHSAYVFRRYTDVRFVFAVELQAGFFGGDGDNFTYPRYALDFAFLRVYDDAGDPLVSPHHFTFSDRGVTEGDLVFVIGNPGSTSRLLTVAQLEYLRDVTIKQRDRVFTTRLAAHRDYYDDDPETAEAMNLRNTMFGISNSQKAYSGRLSGLNEEVIIARRLDAETEFRQRLAEDEALSEAYGDVHDALAALQEEKRAYAAEEGAFLYLESGRMSSAFMRRAVAAYRLQRELASVEGSDRLDALQGAVEGIRDRPIGLESRLLALRFEDFALYLPADDPIVAWMGDRSPQELAEEMLTNSALGSLERSAEAFSGAGLSSDDPAYDLVQLIGPRYADMQSAMGGLGSQERNLQRSVGQARYAVYGSSMPPDATFSPRFTDGVVTGYQYNGTLAPYHTTLFGMLDRHYSHGDHPDWELPERWKSLPADLDLSTSLNFISTSDTIGGNSGSPAVTKELALVGLNFDRSIEGLVRDYMYLPERGRNIMVDMRAVKESLDKVYDADRIVLELTQGVFVQTEAEADARP